MNIFYRAGEKRVNLAEELSPDTRVSDLMAAISHLRSRPIMIKRQKNG